MKFSGRFLLSMMDFASMQGVPYNDLLVVSGLNVNALMQEDELIEGEIFNRTI